MHSAFAFGESVRFRQPLNPHYQDILKERELGPEAPWLVIKQSNHRTQSGEFAILIYPKDHLEFYQSLTDVVEDAIPVPEDEVIPLKPPN